MKKNWTKEEVILAVRSDKIVGRGTCSVIDEAWSDAELDEIIYSPKRKKLVTPAQAVYFARQIHRAWVEREREVRGWAE